MVVDFSHAARGYKIHRSLDCHEASRAALSEPQLLSRTDIPFQAENISSQARPAGASVIASHCIEDAQRDPRNMRNNENLEASIDKYW